MSRADQIASKGRTGKITSTSIASRGRITGRRAIEVIIRLLSLMYRPITLSMGQRSIRLTLYDGILSLLAPIRDRIISLFANPSSVTLDEAEEARLSDRPLILSLPTRLISLEGDYEIMSNREFVESQDGDLEIGENELIEFPFVIPESWQSSPHDPDTPVFTIEDEAGEDVTDTYSDGLPTVEPALYTTPLVSNMVKGKTYKLICQWSDGVNTLEAYGWIRCT